MVIAVGAAAAGPCGAAKRGNGTRAIGSTRGEGGRKVLKLEPTLAEIETHAKFGKSTDAHRLKRACPTEEIGLEHITRLDEVGSKTWTERTVQRNRGTERRKGSIETRGRVEVRK